MRELDKQEEKPSENMRQSYFDHLSVDTLERFVLHRSPEEEVELVETHMLACEACMCALENLELEIAATKAALEQIAAAEPQRIVKAEREPGFWRKWFSVPTLSWAGAGLAACALCFFTFVPANVELTAERGSATVIIPEWRSTHVNLVDEGLPSGPVKAEVVNQMGSVIWSGAASSDRGDVKLELPRIRQAGHYYARLYTPDAQHDLLSEFPFEVKFQL
jgi:anti-sigma factor RsiW